MVLRAGIRGLEAVQLTINMVFMENINIIVFAHKTRCQKQHHVTTTAHLIWDAHNHHLLLTEELVCLIYHPPTYNSFILVSLREHFQLKQNLVDTNFIDFEQFDKTQLLIWKLYIIYNNFWVYPLPLEKYLSSE